MSCGIYKIQNLVTNQVYIGKSRDISRRWAHHKSNARTGDDSCPKLYRAMRKYGLENFSFEILQTMLPTVTDGELDERERYWIKQFNSVLDGYNLTPGGDGGNFSQEAREKAKKATREHFGCDYALQNPEVLEKTKATLMDRYGTDNPMKVPEICQRATTTRAKNGKTTPVVKVETGEIYISLNSAATQNNISKASNIGEVLKGKRQRAGGFHWRRATLEELEAIL